MAGNECISATSRRNRPAEKMGGFARDSWRGGTMEWKVRETLGEFGETFRRRRQCDDGWGGKWWMKKRERGRENQKGEGGQGRAIALFLTPPQKTPWQAVNQTGLAWLIFSSFQSAFLFAFLFSLRMCPDSNIMLSSPPTPRHPLRFTSRPTSGCHVSSPETARYIRIEI